MKNSVEKHNVDWAAISELVPGRTKKQCWDKWHMVLNAKKNYTTTRAGSWTTEEDVKLKDAVEKHNGEDWDAISVLVFGPIENTVPPQMGSETWTQVASQSRRKNTVPPMRRDGYKTDSIHCWL
jgi:hypothetical protein